MAPEALDLLYGYAAQEKGPPIPNHFKQGLDLHQLIISACKVGRRAAPGISRGILD